MVFPEQQNALIAEARGNLPRLLRTITRCPSILVAAAHVSALHPKRGWGEEQRPGDAAEWDRKSLSHENVFTIQGCSLDPGNMVLALVMMMMMVMMMMTVVVMMMMMMLVVVIQTAVGLVPVFPEELPTNLQRGRTRDRARGGAVAQTCEPPMGAASVERKCWKHPIFGSSVKQGA